MYGLCIVYIELLEERTCYIRVWFLRFYILIRSIPITNTHNGQKGIDLIVGKHYTHRKRKHKYFLVRVFRRELTKFIV